MRTVVHLRHAEREPGGLHLTGRGTRQAQSLARRLPRFDLAVTSPKPRAVETAEAMGCPVDRQIAELGGLPGPLQQEIDRRSLRSFRDYVTLVDEVVEARQQAQVLGELLHRELARVREGGHLLVVSHGGVVELGAVGALGTATGSWGPTLGYLEGTRLDLGPAGWVHGEVLRQRP